MAQLTVTALPSALKIEFQQICFLGYDIFLTVKKIKMNKPQSPIK